MKLYKKYSKAGMFLLGSMLSFLSLYILDHSNKASTIIDPFSIVVETAEADTSAPPGGDGQTGDGASC